MFLTKKLYDSLSEGEDGGSDFNTYAEEMLSKCRQLAREKKLERRLHRNDAQWRVEQETSQTFEEDQIKTMPMMPSEEVMSAAPEKVHKTDLGLGEMPTFEHFPLRKISKRSVFQVTEADCRQFVAEMKQRQVTFDFKYELNK